MPNINPHPETHLTEPTHSTDTAQQKTQPGAPPHDQAVENATPSHEDQARHPRESGARGTAAMDPQTRQEVARKGGIAVSQNKQHMAEIGRKGGQSVSKNREHMARIGRKGGAASRGSRGSGSAAGGTA
ncbi:hypothetical protein WDW37_11690 [Bdellovibrionota bacterium FG-1]